MYKRSWRPPCSTKPTLTKHQLAAELLHVAQPVTHLLVITGGRYFEESLPSFLKVWKQVCPPFLIFFYPKPLPITPQVII